MIRFSTKLLLICLLLLSQTALVSHDVEHLESEHNELCVVYLSQDHSASDIAVSAPSIVHVVPERLQVDIVNAFVAVPVSAYASRAPPQTVFLS